jgi:membrane protein implicated in regulation of membrane protease activity
MDDRENVYRQRFLLYSVIRLGGVIIFFLGVAIAYSNLLRPGGWPQVGAIIAIVGAIDALLMPRLFKKSWDRKDQDGAAQ